MKKHVKTLILLVLFLMILALFVGCGNNTVASETGERGAPGEDGVDGKRLFKRCWFTIGDAVLRLPR